MSASRTTLIDLETKFWQSMVNQDTDFPNEKTANVTYHVKQGVATRGNGENSTPPP